METDPLKGQKQRKRHKGKSKVHDPLPVSEVHDHSKLWQLMLQATDYVNSRNPRFKHSPVFYRDKSAKYYQDILQRYGGVMTTYSKDYHGDPRSPINGVLNGLFFSVNVNSRTELPPNTSIYGEVRLSVPASTVLSQYHNLYFTDFYCISTPAHHVTLVMTIPESPADKFCKSRQLVSLDWDLNPFMRAGYVHRTDGYPGIVPVLFVTTGVWVEVYYTAHVMIPEVMFSGGARFDRVTMTGKRSGGRIGLPKNTECTICNV